MILISQVELYFGGDTVNLEFCVRNELEALHSVLEAINKSVSSESCTMKNIKLQLQEEIVNRINEVGKRFREETRIVEDSSIDKEKCLVDWAVKNGLRSKLHIACEYILT